MTEYSDIRHVIGDIKLVWGSVKQHDSVPLTIFIGEELVFNDDIGLIPVDPHELPTHINYFLDVDNVSNDYVQYMQLFLFVVLKCKVLSLFPVSEDILDLPSTDNILRALYRLGLKESMLQKEYHAFIMGRIEAVRKLRQLVLGLHREEDWIRCIDGHWMDLSLQDLIVQSTIKDPLWVEYSPPVEYATDFVKTLTRIVESRGFEVHEELLFFHTLYLTEKNVINEHVVYVSELGNLSDFPLRILPKANDVGLQIWPATFILADYLLENTDALHNSRCLELGSGCGFLAGALACIPSFSVILSDYSSAVVDNLAHNVQVLSSIGVGEGCEVIELDWCSEDAVNQVTSLSPDLIVGADILYSPDLFIPLGSLLSKCLYRLDVRVLIAYELRNKHTFNAFKEVMKSFDLYISIVTDCDGNIGVPKVVNYSYQRDRLCILEIYTIL